jgi:hypothetical protein
MKKNTQQIFGYLKYKLCLTGGDPVLPAAVPISSKKEADNMVAIKTNLNTAAITHWDFKILSPDKAKVLHDYFIVQQLEKRSPKNCPARFAHAIGMQDPNYQYWYPLIDWKMNREDCVAAIESVGLAVPPKSACIFCPATKPDELLTFRKEYLRYIVIMEARARPRLQGLMTRQELDQDYEKRLDQWTRKLARTTAPQLARLLNSKPMPRQVGEGYAGLWREATKEKPAMMTDYILSAGLLDAGEVAALQTIAPRLIEQNITRYTRGGAFQN